MSEHSPDSNNSVAEPPHWPRVEGAYLPLLVALAATIPAIVMRFNGPHPNNHVLAASLFGLAIVGAAFLLSWAAEVAELDISRGLAIAVLAFIAVLPEYAVDLVFAIKGGHAYSHFGPHCLAAGAAGDSPCSLALANMTGANRMLIGVGWPLVAFVSYLAWRRRKTHRTEIKLERSHAVEISFLALAALYSLTLPLRRTVGIIDAVVLIAIFIVYTIRISKAEGEEPELIGPAAWIAAVFNPRARRLVIVGLFLFSAIVILLCAEPFADALVATGRQLGVREFFLVQWVAPLASEAPELLIAGLFAWRLRAEAGLSTLVSSKVNQWTLLVGTLPIAFGIAAGGMHGLPLDTEQRQELLLTATQTIFAVSVLTNFSLSLAEGVALVCLFFLQFVLSALFGAHHGGSIRVGISVCYALATIALLVKNRDSLRTLKRDGFSTSYEELSN